MQTLLAAGVLFAIVWLGVPAVAQTPGPSVPPGVDQRTPEPSTDAFPIGAMGSQDGDVRLDVVRRHIPGGGADAYWLKFQALKKGPRPRFQIAILEAQELPALMAALERMAKIVAESDPGQTAADSAAYKGDTVSVALSPGGATRRLYVQVGATNPTRVAFPIDDLNAMTAYIQRAAAKIRDLERDEKKRREKLG